MTMSVFARIWDQERCVNRQLIFPVSTMSQWWGAPGTVHPRP
jgi:hypothetical protein